MKLNTMFFLTLAASLLGTSLAHPGMHNALAGLSSLAKRQPTPEPELLADLKTLPDSALSPTGRTIKNILLHNQAAAPPTDDTTFYTAPGPLDSPACRNSTCCVFKHAADAMATLFRPSPTSPCTELARQAIRLGFHDAGTWTRQDGPGNGGADGSIILADEHLRTENRGLESITDQMRAWYATYHPHGAGMADLIHLGATVAAVSCPLGPRVRSFVGRPDSSLPEPEGRLPNVTDDAESLVALFADKTFGLGDLIALVGAHTTSTQRFVDPARAGAPQDTSPGVWDVRFYDETARRRAPGGVLRFESDLALARYPEARGFWRAFADSEGGQGAWNHGYAAAYVRMSVLGVEHINDLEECTGVLPLRITETQWSSDDIREPWRT